MNGKSKMWTNVSRMMVVLGIETIESPKLCFMVDASNDQHVNIIHFLQLVLVVGSNALTKYKGHTKKACRKEPTEKGIGISLSLSHTLSFSHTHYKHNVETRS